MIAARLFEFLEQIAPLHLQENYDNAGLIIGNANSSISGVLFCLDVTEEVLDEALELGCNIVVSHHPIIFRALKKLPGDHYVERTVIKAIKNDLLIYAIHTNLDNVLDNGVSQYIAKRLQLQDIHILQALPGYSNLGSGVIGHLENPLSVDDFFQHLKNRMQISQLKFSQNKLTSVSKIAICGGSGAFLIETAKNSGADLFITSDLKYHDYFEGNSQFCLVDIGHYESEKYTSELLYNLVTQNFTTFAAHCSKVNTNPVKYL